MKSNTLINYLVWLYNVGTFSLNIFIFIHYLKIYIIFRIFCNGTVGSVKSARDEQPYYSTLVAKDLNIPQISQKLL
jgi:hypothetical protein